MTIINLDPGESFGWYVKIVSKTDYTVDLNVYSVLSYGENNVPLFGDVDPDDNDSLTDDIEKAKRFAHCCLKWDACNHWFFDVQNQSMIHLCGLRKLKSFTWMIKEVTRVGRTLITAADLSLWGENE